MFKRDFIKGPEIIVLFVHFQKLMIIMFYEIKIHNFVEVNRVLKRI